MKKINIALMAGGNSSERVISVQSASQVADQLDRNKYNVYLIDVYGKEWNYIDDRGEKYPLDKNDFSLQLKDSKILLDYALIIIHGSPGEDGMLQGYLDLMRIPYSSCNMVSTVITFDKLACKRAVSDTGINLADHVYVSKGDIADPDKIIDKLGLPVFVKPNASGSSFGVTKVNHKEEILPALLEALKESDGALVEEYIPGREFSCGIMITKHKEYIFPVTEIISKKDFFDFQAKYTPGFSDEITPADLDPNIVKVLNQMCKQAYTACNCRGIVRIDFIVNNEGKPYMIEINSIPGMSPGSIIPKQAACMGFTLGQIYDIIIEDTYFER